MGDVDDHRPAGMMQLCWEPLCGPVTLSRDGRTVTLNHSDGGSARGTTPNAPSFQVCVRNLATQGTLWIGYIESAIFAPVTEPSGWILESGTGNLLNAKDGSLHLARYCCKIRHGDVVTSSFDKEACTISYAVNGVNFGVAFEQVYSDLSLFPFILLDTEGDSVTLLL